MEKPILNWLDEQTRVFLNPRLPQAIYQELENSLKPYKSLKGHIWIASSGTEDFPKLIALSKNAFLASAKGVNDHFNIDSRDRWLNILPHFHVGGLGPHARAFLSQSFILDDSEHKWDPTRFTKLLEDAGITITSLTPTHIYDLVASRCSPTKSLRAVIVGGGALSRDLHEQASNLGWPLFCSYGMTEVCSQIATTKRSGPGEPLEVLNHVAVRINDEGMIEIQSEALLTGYIGKEGMSKHWIEPVTEGWFTTQDRGILNGSRLIVEGRGANFLKIGGENVNFTELESVWEKIKLQYSIPCDTALIDLPDERLGKAVYLAATKKFDWSEPLKSFQKEVLPIASIRAVHLVEKIPRTELHKLKKEELRRSLKAPHT